MVIGVRERGARVAMHSSKVMRHRFPNLHGALSESNEKQIHCETVGYGLIDFNDPIFDAIRESNSHLSATGEIRSGPSPPGVTFVVRWPNGSYAGIASIEVVRDREPRSKPDLIVTTFRVENLRSSSELADILLSKALENAVEHEAERILISASPRDSDLIKYLEFRGFRSVPGTLKQGQRQYAVELSNPDGFYASLNRLAYDLLAEEYRHRSMIPGPSQATPESLAALLESRLIKPVRRVLELGPGSGDVLSALGTFSEQTVAIEISPKMAQIAQSRARNAQVVVGNAMEVDFVDHSFDGVYAGAFIHLFPPTHAARLVARISRWTRPAGTVFVNTSVVDRNSASFQVKRDYNRRVVRYRSRWTEEQFRRLLEDNGLHISERVTTEERERGKSWVGFLCTPG